MKIPSYHADGALSHETEAVSRQEADDNYIPGTWHIWLESGKHITNSDEKLDTFYRGWRDLPEIAKAKGQL